MEFPSDVNAIYMRIDTLIPSQTNLLYDFGKRSPLEQFLTKSLIIAELDCEELSSTSELIEKILAYKMNEE